VEYTATELGMSLQPIFLSLCEWGRRHAAQLDELERIRECAVE
jgi:DNA-binding HxlR family transcriptional regulator